jgi:drug/metabolite transporter (DMT)-like permease
VARSHAISADRGGYGVSLALFILALRHLGTPRTGVYFPLAPSFGAAASFPLLHEPIGPAFMLAAGLMALGYGCT